MDLISAYKIIAFIWYTLVFLLFVYVILKYRNSFEETNEQTKSNPKDLSLSELSYLLYGKIGRSTLVATILRLIDEGVIRISKKNNDYQMVFNLEKKEKLIGSDIHIVEFLSDMKENASLSNLRNYCTNNNTSTDFLSAYKFWKKKTFSDMKKRDFFVIKSEYYLIRNLKILGYTLFITNIIYKFGLLSPFFMPIATIVLTRYFYITRRIRSKYIKDYIKALKYKNYITSEKNIESTKLKEILPYASIYKVLNKVELNNTNAKVTFSVKLEEAIYNAVKDAELKGNRSVLDFVRRDI